MSDFIKAHHPVTGGQAEFAETAFEEVWSPLGWEKGWPEPAEPVQQDITEEEAERLRAKAAELGVVTTEAPPAPPEPPADTPEPKTRPR